MKKRLETLKLGVSMINNKSVLAIIPARGGSKGVPRKNIKDLAGKPLIAWTIEEAKRSKYIDKLVVSSDDQEIIDVSIKWGVDAPVRRPSELAQDDTPGIDPILHALEFYQEYEYVVLLQPTSPLRNVKDIDGAIKLFALKEELSCVSVTESSKSPYWMYKISKEGTMLPLFSKEDIPYQRQQAPKFYELNGAVYVATSKSLKATSSFLQDGTIPYVMPRERSIDIDNVSDFEYCEFLLMK